MDVETAESSGYAYARSSRNIEENEATTENRKHVDKEVNSSSKILNYLLFKHGAELGIVGWLAVIFAILNFAWAVKGLTASTATAEMAVTQSALGNQLNFLKMCLDYPNLGTQDSSLTGIQTLFRKVPCEAFLRALDFDAMSRVLVDPRMVPDIKLPPTPGELGRHGKHGERSFVGEIAEIFGLLFSLDFLRSMGVIFIVGVILMVIFLLMAFIILGLCIGFTELVEWWQKRQQGGQRSIPP